MSTGAIVQNGLSQALTDFTSVITSTPYACGLYTNNYTIVPTSTISNITEASYSGYARQDIAGALSPVWDSGTNSYTQQFTPLSFTISGSGPSSPIYGWFMVDGSGNLVCGDLLYTSGQVLSSSFPTISFIPSINISNA